MTEDNKQPPGRGRFGDLEGHRAAGRLGGLKSSGKFKTGDQRTVDAARAGGRVSRSVKPKKAVNQ